MDLGSARVPDSLLVAIDMHHALHIQEILLNIFGHCCSTSPHGPDRRLSTATLAALARACRAFKEPALDVLWSDLDDLTPLSRCIPEACCVGSVNGRGVRTQFVVAQLYSSTLQPYSCKARPAEAEWDILRSYTRRIWRIHIDYDSYDGWLDVDSLIATCSPPVADPLFPNLRSLHWIGKTMRPAVHVQAAVPSLTSLYLDFTEGDVPALKEFLDAVGAHCRNMRDYHLVIPRPHLFDNIICSHIRRQTHLWRFRCHGVSFDADTISHLSQISTLTSLSLTGIPRGPYWTFASDSVPVFSTLTRLGLGLHSLELVTALLSCTRPLAIEELDVEFSACPSKAAFKTYLTTLRQSCSPESLTTMKLCGTQQFMDGIFIESDNRLGLDDLGPSMAFVHLRHIHINLQWSVDLTDSDVLALASKWPHVRSLVINDRWGWRTTTGGITFRGLAQLLYTCRTLSELCIALHADSLAHLPQDVDTARGFLLSRSLVLNVADSPIRWADGAALVDVFVALGMSGCSFEAWCGVHMQLEERAGECQRVWNWVFGRVVGRYSGPIGGWGSVVVESEEDEDEDESSVMDDESFVADDESFIEEEEDSVEEEGWVEEEDLVEDEDLVENESSVGHEGLAKDEDSFEEKEGLEDDEGPVVDDESSVEEDEGSVEDEGPEVVDDEGSGEENEGPVDDDEGSVVGAEEEQEEGQGSVEDDEPVDEGASLEYDEGSVGYDEDSVGYDEGSVGYDEDSVEYDDEDY